jgi:hypothetical protein
MSGRVIVSFNSTFGSDAIELNLRVGEGLLQDAPRAPDQREWYAIGAALGEQLERWIMGESYDDVIDAEVVEDAPALPPEPRQLPR